MIARDPFSEVVDQARRWNPEWYAWVTEVVAELSPPVPTTVTTAAATVSGRYVICNQAGTTTLTLPAAATFPSRELLIKTTQAQAVVSASANVVPSTGVAAGTAILPATDGAWALLVSDGTNWIIMAAQPLV